jgi:catechol 2,3-dioxygenase-like lactoylglutathione lyase family enzyme
MEQSIIHVALVVRDYDEAIEFFCQKLNFTLVEDTYQPEQDKRWVVVKPPAVSQGRDTRTGTLHWEPNRRPGVSVSQYR